MPIDFNEERNKSTYTGRTADGSWRKAIVSVVEPDGRRIADVGCGGGIYSRAWLALGASKVIGVDSSATMISAAVESSAGLPNISFQLGSATSTGIPDNSVDIVFERALIHHVTELLPCFEEAMRILKPGGVILIQDRTPEDVSLAGSSEHIRGYFFECFPRLLEIESARRRSSQMVLSALERVGFQTFEPMTVWETRKIYSSVPDLSEDLRQRRGRSILHELTDNEVASLISFIENRLEHHAGVIEKDRWTIWHASKPRRS